MAKAISADLRFKTPMTISVPVRVREQVEELARKTNVTLSEVCRGALEEYVNKKTRTA